MVQEKRWFVISRRSVCDVQSEEGRSKIHTDNTSAEGVGIGAVQVRHALGLSFLKNSL